MQAIITLENKKQIVIELFAEDAPKTVENFVSLIKKGFYDGLVFHRVIPGFVAQTGCPFGTGVGGPGYTIPCETEGNPNQHERGSVSMAHRGKDTGGSQFFVCIQPQPHLDGVHTVFGKVVEGMKNIDLMKQGDAIESIVIKE